MACDPVQVPLSYSIPSFNAKDYDGVVGKLNQLQTMGFRWVTFTPTFQITESFFDSNSLLPRGNSFSDKLGRVFFKTGQWFLKTFKDIPEKIPILTLDLAATPSYEKIRSAVLEAVAQGFSVKLEPHLDFTSTLQSTTEKDWRLRMYFDPLISPPGYFERVLSPLFAIILEASTLTPRVRPECKPCFALTLGSEVDVSVYEFSASWRRALGFLKTMRANANLNARLVFGHKINHDSFQPSVHIKGMLTQARKARSTGRVTLSDSFMQTLKEGILRYLRELDYVSFSLYARINARKPDGSPVNWEGPGSDEDLRAISSAFRAVADGWRSELGSGVVLDIGEFGLGTPDIGSPENDFPDPFLDQNRQMRDSARNMRRNYYRGFLRFLREHSDLFKKENACSTFQPATFWTVKQFDFLGLWNYPIPLTEGGQVPHEIFHDEELGSWIYLWNEETYFHVDDG